MDGIAVQDTYPADVAVCYGCGRMNDSGLHIRTLWDGQVGVTQVQPRPEHTAMQGIVYGGLLASLVDCHSIATASAAAMAARGVEVGREPAWRYVTAKLDVGFRAPTPLGPPLTLRAWPVQVGERKVVVEAEVLVAGTVTVTGHVVAAPLPEQLRPAAG